MDKDKASWREVWSYQKLVFREAGFPPVRDWIGALLAALITGVVENGLTGDWSLLLPVAAGILGGSLFYMWDLSRASATLHFRLSPDQPDVDARLRLIQQIPSMSPKYDPWALAMSGLNKMGTSNPTPNPRHRTRMVFEVVEPFDPPEITVTCTAPIHRVSSKIHSDDHRSRLRCSWSMSRALVKLPSPALVGVRISVIVYAEDPIYLLRVDAAT